MHRYLSDSASAASRTRAEVLHGRGGAGRSSPGRSRRSNRRGHGERHRSRGGGEFRSRAELEEHYQRRLEREQRRVAELTHSVSALQARDAPPRRAPLPRPRVTSPGRSRQQRPARAQPAPGPERARASPERGRARRREERAPSPLALARSQAEDEAHALDAMRSEVERETRRLAASQKQLDSTWADIRTEAALVIQTAARRWLTRRHAARARRAAAERRLADEKRSVREERRRLRQDAAAVDRQLAHLARETLLSERQALETERERLLQRKQELQAARRTQSAMSHSAMSQSALSQSAVSQTAGRRHSPPRVAAPPPSVERTAPADDEEARADARQQAARSRAIRRRATEEIRSTIADEWSALHEQDPQAPPPPPSVTRSRITDAGQDLDSSTERIASLERQLSQMMEMVRSSSRSRDAEDQSYVPGRRSHRGAEPPPPPVSVQRRADSRRDQREREEGAALLLQKTYRGHRGRQRALGARDELSAQLQEEDAAASRLQAAWRGVSVRKGRRRQQERDKAWSLYRGAPATASTDDGGASEQAAMRREQFLQGQSAGGSVLLRVPEPEPDEARLEEMFDRVDGDGDGVILSAELEQLLAAQSAVVVPQEPGYVAMLLEAYGARYTAGGSAEVVLGLDFDGFCEMWEQLCAVGAELGSAVEPYLSGSNAPETGSSTGASYTSYSETGDSEWDEDHDVAAEELRSLSGSDRFDDEQEAATLVQSAWRGAAARRQQLLSEGAAISIQASWRAKNARKALAELRAMGMSEGDIRWMIREVPATRATVCLAGLRV